MAITKIEIVNMFCEQMDMPKVDCIRIMESFFEIIKSEFEKGIP